METFSFQFVNIFTFQTAARILHERLINMETECLEAKI